MLLCNMIAVLPAALVHAKITAGGCCSVVVITSAASAASAGPAMELLTKLYFREVFRAVVHRRQRVFHRRRASIHTGAADVA